MSGRWKDQRQERTITCAWWNRWLHRRRRDADVMFLLPAIRVRAEMATDAEPWTEAWSRDKREAVSDGYSACVTCGYTAGDCDCDR